MTRARDLAAFVSNADGDIKFDTDTLFIDSSANKVGIRTDTPPHPLSVFGTGAGNATVQIEGEGGADPTINFLANNTQHWAIGVDDSDSDTFKISEHSALGTNDYVNVDVNGSVGIGVTPDTSSTPSIQIGSGVINNISNFSSLSENSYYNSGWKYVSTAGSSLYQSKAGTHYFFQAASGTADTSITYNEKVRIDSDGLKFNGDTAAVNAINDYEEGTWTPDVSQGTISPDTNGNIYIKIGNKVTAWCRFTTFSDTTSSNQVNITGLPFPVGTNKHNTNVATIWGTALGGARTAFGYAGSSGTTLINLYYSAGSTTTGFDPVVHSDMNSSTDMIVRIEYHT